MGKTENYKQQSNNLIQQCCQLQFGPTQELCYEVSDMETKANREIFTSNEMKTFSAEKDSLLIYFILF